MMKIKLKKKVKTKAGKIIAAFLAINILFEAIAPTCVFALTGGPSQPEVQSFAPVGTSDMVNAFSGDFNYNIPLMDVDGYPINIGYNSGITMDQEASWVGLGWNISPGVINRGMRGIPDDFNGEAIVKELNMKPSETYGLNVGAGIELFGLNKVKLGVGYSLGIKYNNYTGYGVDQSINLSLGAGGEHRGPLTGGLGINSSSEEGLTLSPSVGLNKRISKTEQTTNSLSVTIGSAFNSRAGLKTLSISSSQSVSSGSMEKSTYGMVSTKGSKTASGSVASSSFNFGMPTFTPQASLPMQNISITGNFKIGWAGYGLHPNVTVGGFYAGQKLATNTISNPAYGYMNADEGTKYDNALMDFNREKDGAFTPSTPALPVTNFTYDVFAVSGQGVGGSYRSFRSDMGHVFDPNNYTTSEGYSVGAEVGVGTVFHFGVDATVNSSNGYTGRWKEGNMAAKTLTHKATSNNPLYEKYYFKEANEKSVDADTNFFAKAGGAKAQSIYLNQYSKFNTVADNYYSTYKKNPSNLKNEYNKGNELASDNVRNAREKRNQLFTTLNREELETFGLQNNTTLLTNVGVNSADAKNHHIAEITTLRNDGARYVYGIAAYNTKQEEATFAVGNDIQNQGYRPASLTTGLVKYSSGDNEVTSNNLGRDNYVSVTKTPAFAHSYLLTAVLSPDYVDSEDNGSSTRGPSDGDIGSFTKFNYLKIDNYKWRTPVGERQATHNEGLKSDSTDDKANYIYGEKALYYLSSIETKNYIAVFTLEDRDDGYGVQDKNGKLATTKPMKLLKKISLYAKRDYKVNPTTAVAIKTVNFVYDYSLCQGITNNKNAQGKLTLKEIYFTYQNSNKARLSPYKFGYADPDHDGVINTDCNPNYNIKAYDRWGNYKPIYDDNGNKLYSSEYPYVEQDSINANKYTQAWTLTDIMLPSGGKIKVDYESDDYAYVQNKQANQMFKVIAVQQAFKESTSDFTVPSIYPVGNSQAVQPINFPHNSINPDNNGTRLIIKLQSTLTGTATQKNAAFKNLYLNGIDYLYFRFLMRIKEKNAPLKSYANRDEYVSGYLTRADIDDSKSYVDVTGNYACIAIKNVDVDDNAIGNKICPITKAAIQFGRLNMSKEVWNSEAPKESSDMEKILNELANSSFVKNLGDMIQGPNLALYNKNIGKQALMGQSWVRLKNPNKKKLGGGCRVKKIVISDEWDGFGISNNASQAGNYGQEYSYTLADGTSSGVATYEPQLGGDENPWKVPVFFSTKKLLAPDDEHYMEEPFGESFFPSPSVGYSCVTIKNLQRPGVTHHATGKVVHNFYTAKDYPTITERTDLKTKREKANPFSLISLFKVDSKDFMTASQGYLIEINDMHGKLRSEEVYQEGANRSLPISSIEYRYKSQPYLNGSFRLDSKSTVLYSNGMVDNNATIGMFFDFVSDMREATNETESSAVGYNTEGFIIPPFPVVIPVSIPSLTTEKTQFRSAVITKVIQRFGILEETISRDLGSVVSTKNLAYDAETGDVVLTKTSTNYNDEVYALNYPAYWYYDGMGPAYKNVGYGQSGINFNVIVVNPVTNAVKSIANVNNALLYFAEGDEIAIQDPANPSLRSKAWVTAVTANSVEIINRQGEPVAGTFIKILRSGRRNQQNVPMASIATFTNPLNNLAANIYENVLQAQAIEYTNSWKTFCDCFQGGSTVYSDNPYVIGTKGMYKNNKTFLHLSGRTQSNYNGNTNTRKDGVFTTYTPFYKMNEGKWETDRRNWTYTSEVTEYSPFGAELENRDALGRYTSAVYGYAQTLPTAKAVNVRYRSMGVDNFEDYDFKTCADNHFKFKVTAKSGTSSTSETGGVIDPDGPSRSLYYNNIDDTESHTGNYSLKVASGTPVNMLKQLNTNCDLVACNLVDSTYSLHGNFYVKIKNGALPYQFDWSSSNCDLPFTISNEGHTVSVKIPAGTAGLCNMVLTVIDKNNCKKMFSFKF